MRPPLPFTKPAMPKTCQSCLHWTPMKSDRARCDGPLGECREASPTRDLAWPRTRSVDFCSRYRTANEGVAYASGPDKGPGTPLERAGQDPRAEVPASAPQQLSLVADPAAPKPVETGKNPPADAPGGPRPRSAKASPKAEAPAPRATGRAGDE
jgi:hypothetical protein